MPHFLLIPLAEVDLATLRDARRLGNQFPGWRAASWSSTITSPGAVGFVDNNPLSHVAHFDKLTTVAIKNTLNSVNSDWERGQEKKLCRREE